MGNFKNVTMGNGVLKVNGVDVGFLKGEVGYRYNYDIERFKTGVPKVLRGSVTKEVIAELTAPLAEISTANMAMALGGLPITTTGSPVVIGSGAPSVRTFKAFNGGEAIVLDGPGVTNSTLVIKSSDNVTTYASDGTDYLLIPGLNGSTSFVYRNPDGAIPSGATVNCTYTYTQATGKQINLGTQFSLAENDVEFVHKSPVTKLNKTVKMWKANTNGQFEVNWAEESFIINNVTFEAIFDDEHADNPLGYYHDEEAA